ncbi:MAG: GNAT family N-acetyltransferase [Lachnospiraceae bacterium]|nr:GNAT family N-acetyltransferase [Lachnospiraceae bacterium]
MLKIIDEKFDNVFLRNIETDEEIHISPDDCTNIRVKTPAKYNFQTMLEKQGFFHADRMLKVSINLKKISPEIDKKIRQKVIKSDAFEQEIFDISKNSFPVDRRFHVGKDYNNAIADKIIASVMNDIEEYYIVFFKDIPVGFAGIKEIEKDIYEIKLAAVDEKYRMTGAALSLYSYLIKTYSEKGGKQLIGWISTVNVAVMNLYSALGAVFSEPSDIFIWEKS